MGTVNPTLGVLGQARGDQEAADRTALQTLLAEFNGNIDDANLKAALKAVLGVSDGITARRGKSIIPATESRTNVAYGTLTTPDQVSVTLPQDGLIAVAYQATWQESVSGAARAGIFVGANEVVVAPSTAVTGAPSATSPEGNPTSASFPNTDLALSSYPGGLKSETENSTAYTGDVTTGQVVGLAGGNGGPCYIFAAAGTYAVSIQFKSSSGSVTVKNRKLWVWTLGF
jgi:hypothetical protein